MTGLAARVLTGAPVNAREARPGGRASAKTKVPTARELHMLNRFGAGYTPASYKQLRKAGGAQQWFERQLKPGKVREAALAKQLLSWFPALSWSLEVKNTNDRSGAYMAWEHARDLGNLSLLRRTHSRRELLEQMTDFWSNHLHVPAGHDFAWIHRKSYDDLLRKHALSSFEELLLKATLHPAMQLYLDNFLSEKDAPNENHGRELLELHTVGRTTGYTEEMVKDSAKILSGYTLDTDTWAPSYDPKRHTTGAVKVLGFKSKNAKADGRKVTREYLRYLAHHPATARRIAYKLAVRFVSDDPSPHLVKKLAKVYLKNDTDIKAVLRALVRSSEFWAAKDKKVRTPYDDVVATCRSLRVSPSRPAQDSSFGNALNWMHGAVSVYQWPAPDGAPDNAEAWSGVSRILRSFQFHWNMGGGWWPKDDVAYRKALFWLPEQSISFDEFVDHLSRTWHGRKSTPQLLKAACQATNLGPHETITKDHQLMTWMFPRLAGVLLDSPKHLSR